MHAPGTVRMAEGGSDAPSRRHGVGTVGQPLTSAPLAARECWVARRYRLPPRLAPPGLMVTSGSKPTKSAFCRSGRGQLQHRSIVVSRSVGNPRASMLQHPNSGGFGPPPYANPAGVPQYHPHNQPPQGTAGSYQQQQQYATANNGVNAGPSVMMQQGQSRTLSLTTPTWLPMPAFGFRSLLCLYNHRLPICPSPPRAPRSRPLHPTCNGQNAMAKRLPHASPGHNVLFASQRLTTTSMQDDLRACRTRLCRLASQ
jgi:hypothetical protein